MPPRVKIVGNLRQIREVLNHAYLRTETERGREWKHQSTAGCLREERR